MTLAGRIRVWHEDEGWGVIDSAQTPGGCWAHYSGVRVEGYQVLTTGQDVRFDVEVAEQDGYSFRAVGVWPADQGPVVSEPAESGPSSAHQSTLTFTFDGDEDDAVTEGWR